MKDTTQRRPINWVSGATTDKGIVREINEDALISLDQIDFWAVADGMGGHSVGDFASNLVVDYLADVENYTGLADMVDSLEDTLFSANKSILDYAEEALDKATIGSTVIGLLIRGHVGVCLWAGDSRLYRFRNNELRQLSSDHSQVQEWVDQGLISVEDSENHPQGNVITRAIGVDKDVTIDMNIFSARIGDTYLLCSDGLHNVVSKPAIESCLSNQDPQVCADELMALALENGAPDNVTVVVVKGEPGKINAANLASMQG